MIFLETKTKAQLLKLLKTRRDILNQGGVSTNRKKAIEDEISQIQAELNKRKK